MALQGGTLRPNPLAPGMGEGMQGTFRARAEARIPGLGNSTSTAPFVGDARDDLAQDQGASPGAGPESGSPDYAAEGEGVMPQLLGEAKGLEDQLDKANQSVTRLGKILGGLERLAQLGDTVTPDDVVEESGRFVEAGLSARALAGALASMPTQSQAALAGWIGKLGASVAQMKQQREAQQKELGHELSRSGMKLLLASKAQQNSAQMREMAGLGASPGAPPQGPNSVPGPGGPTEEPV